MTRAVRLSAALLLAGLALVLMPGEVWAENEAWRFGKVNEPSSNKPGGIAASILFYDKVSPFPYGYADIIAFACVRDAPVSEFGAVVSVVYDNQYPWGDYTVVWKVDDGPETKAIWQPNTEIRNMGLVLVGQQALDLALEIANGKKLVKIKTPRGTIVNDLKSAKKIIGRLIKYCRLN